MNRRTPAWKCFKVVLLLQHANVQITRLFVHQPLSNLLDLLCPSAFYTDHFGVQRPDAPDQSSAINGFPDLARRCSRTTCTGTEIDPFYIETVQRRHSQATRILIYVCNAVYTTGPQGYLKQAVSRIHV